MPRWHGEWQDWDSNPDEVRKNSGGLGALRWEWAGNREKDTGRKERALRTCSAPGTSLSRATSELVGIRQDRKIGTTLF